MTPDTVLSLGDLDFVDFEVPPDLRFGGEQMLVVHRLPGGARVVDAMGADDAQIEFGGIFFGPDAEDRARYLDGLRARGAELLLTWSSFQKRVVIQNLELVFRRFYHIDYKICLTVIEDQTASLTSLPGGYGSLHETFLGDLDVAKELGVDLDDSFITEGLDSIDSVISTVSDIAKEGQKVINSILTPIVAVQQRVKTLISSTTNTLRNITTLGGLLPNNPLAKQINKFSTQVSGYTDLPKLYQLQSTLGRMDVSLGQAVGFGDTVRSIRTVGGDLFDVAQKTYGDATKWAGIASANDLDDPFVEGDIDLKVPDSPPDSGGVVGAE